MTRSITLMCVMSMAWLGCSGSFDDEADGPTRSSLVAGVDGEQRSDPTRSQILGKKLVDVQVARWAGFQRLAVGRADHDVLGAELFRTMRDNTVAVLTVVVDGAAMRYVINGDGHGGPRFVNSSLVATSDDASTADGGALPPDYVSSGRPPPQYPVPPAVVAAGNGLLMAAFSNDGASDRSFAAETQSTCPTQTAKASLRTLQKETDDVLAARWEGFKQLAQGRAERDVLAMEVLRTLNNETVVVFTMVQNGTPVRYVLRADSDGQPLAARGANLTDDPSCAAPVAATMAFSDGSVDPALDSYGRPPPQLPIPPNLTATGETALMNMFGSGQ